MYTIGLIVSYLYATSGLIAIFGYLPQIKVLIKGNKSPTEISINTLSIWVLEGLIALGYGVLCLKDLFFSLYTILDVSCLCAILILVIYNRYVKFGNCHNLFSAFCQYYFVHPY